MRPLSHADLQAILAHRNSDPDQLLAGTEADRPVAAMRVRATCGPAGRLGPGHLAADAGG